MMTTVALAAVVAATTRAVAATTRAVTVGEEAGMGAARAKESEPWRPMAA